jgi:predicted glycoside hydrolase/deacetylase ChbG (UPF0249 family)
MTQRDRRTSAEALGYPADARLLLVNADDFGMYPGINSAVARAFSEGIVRSSSLMMPCPGAAEAIRSMLDHPDIRSGVHLSIVNDIPGYRWGPIADRTTVPSLLDEDGHFFMEHRIPDLLARATITDLETEFRAQIDAAFASGINPTHLDWHCLYDGGRPDIFELTLGLARESGLALRVSGDDAVARVCSLGLPRSDHGMVDSFRLPISAKAAVYADLLRTLPPGLNEWAVHPGGGDAASRALDPNGWQVRQTDLAFLISSEARDIVHREGIILIGYDALQKAWGV